MYDEYGRKKEVEYYRNENFAQYDSKRDVKDYVLTRVEKRILLRFGYVERMYVD